MEITGVQQGVWRLEQNSQTLTVRLLKYNELVEEWQENRSLTWDEMHETLAYKSYEKRGDK